MSIKVMSKDGFKANPRPALKLINDYCISAVTMRQVHNK